MAHADWILEVHDPGHPVTATPQQQFAMPIWESISVTIALNRPGTLSVTTLGDTSVDAFLESRRTDLVLKRDGLPWFRGRLIVDQDDLTDTHHMIQLEALDYAGVLQHRYLMPEDIGIGSTKVPDERPDGTGGVAPGFHGPARVVLPNNDRANAWDKLTTYREGTIVVDAQEAFPNQLYEAIADFPDSRISSWEFSRAYKTGDLVAYDDGTGEKVWRATSDHAAVRQWSEATTYSLGTVVEHGNRFWRCAIPNDPSTGRGQLRKIEPGRIVNGWGQQEYDNGALVIIGTNIFRASKAIRKNQTLNREIAGAFGESAVRDFYDPNTGAGEAQGWRLLLRNASATAAWTQTGVPSDPFSEVAPSTGGRANAGWGHATPKRPALDPAHWKRVANDSYKARLYRSIPQEDIAWDLIELTQRRSFGDLGITRETVDGQPVPGGRKRDRTFMYLSQTIFELIDDVGQAADGFEWWIDADRVWHSQSPARFRDRRDDVALVYGANVSHVQRENATEYFSAAIAEGDEDLTTPVGVEVTPDDRGRWETYWSNRDIVKQSTLRERSDALLDAAGQTLPWWRATLTPGVFNAGDIQLGDMIPFEVKRPPRLKVLGFVRVVEISLRLSPDGDEQVTLGLQTVDDIANLNDDRHHVGNRVDRWRTLGDTLAQLDAKVRKA